MTNHEGSQASFPPIPPEPRYIIYRPFRPWATYTILAINLAVFVLMACIDLFHHPPLRDWALRTFTGVDSDPTFFLRFGASFGPFTRRGEYWRLIMPMFIHGGMIHLLVNGYSLYILGIFVERVYGYARFTFLYVACGVGSAAVSMSLSDKVSVGASGAIFGLAGVMLAAGYRHREFIPRHWARVFGKGIIPVILLNLALGFALRQWIDNWAHLGGLACGIVLGFAIPPVPHELALEPSMDASSLALVGAMALIVLVGAVAEARDYRRTSAVIKLLDQGSEFQAANRDDLAIQRYKAAAAMKPLDDRPHDALGELYLSEKKWKDAAQEFESAVRLNSDPILSSAPFGLAKAYREMGQESRAQETIRTLMRYIPKNDADAESDLATTFDKYGLWPEAIDHYKQAVRLEPGSAVALNGLAWLYATCDDAKYRDPKDSLQLAQKAVDLTKWRQPEIVDTLAEALYANHRFAEAVKVETRALQLDPHNHDYLDHMARYRKAAEETKQPS